MVSPRPSGRFFGLFNLKDRKLFNKLLLSFIAIGLVPVLIISLLTYGRLFNILKQNVISSNVDYMEQGKNNLDAYIKQIQEMRAQLSNNKNVNSFFTKKDEGRVNILFYIKDIIDEINKYGVAAYEITDVLAIYFPENNVVVTNKTYYEGDSFFREYRKYEGMTSDECFKKLSEVNTREYWEARTVFDEYDKPKRVITCIQEVPQYSKNYGYLITMIAEDKLWNLFGKSNTASWENFRGIVDENGNLVACSDPENIPSIVNTIPGSFPPDVSGHFEVEDEHGARYIVTYTVSSPVSGKSSWRYFGIIPEKAIMERISSVTLLYVGTLVIALLLALALSWYLSQRNYKPVKDIIHLIKSNVKKQYFQESSELNIIRDTVSDMFKVTREMEEKLNQHVGIARMHFLMRLLKGMANKDQIREAINLYSIELPYNYFVVAIMELKYSNGTHRHGSSQSYSSFARFAATNIIEKTLNEQSRTYHVEIDENRIAMLINTDLAHEGKGRSHVENKLREMIELLELKSGVHAVIGIGKEYPSLGMVNNSYNEALTALDYIMVRGSYQIMHYERMKPSKSNIYYPLAKEQQLLNQVKLGDFKAAEATIDEIYRVNFVERDIPVKLAQYLLNNLVSSLFRVLDELTLDLDVIFEPEGGLDMDISNAGRVEEIFSYIKRNLMRICEIITEKKNSHNTKLRDKIIEYINTYYSDRNLSLTSVADKFNLTTPYLSRFFKEQTGYNFNDYLNQCRTRKAKAFLCESGLTIAEIAEMIGYNSPGTFIRIFKKYESVTPGQYRDVFNNIKI